MKAKRLGSIALISFAAWLLMAQEAGSEWIWLLVMAALCLAMSPRVRQQSRAIHANSQHHARVASPRAAMERKWSRLGSARGRLLADADRQSEYNEAFQRLEYRQSPFVAQGWRAPQDKAQAYDLQMPGAAMPKRKGKPKRRY